MHLESHPRRMLMAASTNVARGSCSILGLFQAGLPHLGLRTGNLLNSLGVVRPSGEACVGRRVVALGLLT